MKTDRESLANPGMSPDQLQSDMDTIKGVLTSSERSSDIHRYIIAAGNLLTAFLLLLAVPILILVPGIVGLTAKASDAQIVGLTMLIPISILCVLAAPFALAGWGVLRCKGWGNVMAIVAGILNLCNVPLGTALGIYTFWAVAERRLVTRD